MTRAITFYPELESQLWLAPFNIDLSSYIPPPLQHHPRQTSRTNKYRPRQPLAPLRRAVDKPLSGEMHKC